MHNSSKIQSSLDFGFCCRFSEILKKVSECLFQAGYFQKV